MDNKKKRINPIFYIFWAMVTIGLVINAINESRNPPKPESGTRIIYTISSTQDNAWASWMYLGRNGSKFGSDAIWHLPFTKTVYLQDGEKAMIKATLLGTGTLSCTISTDADPEWRSSGDSGKRATVECSGIVGQK